MIDLFAGPGGLAEGIASLTGPTGERIFDVRLSIEKEPFARKTLLLRAFTRQFPVGKLPDEYYDYLRSPSDVERAARRLALEEKYSDQFKAAEAEAWLKELGKPARKTVSERIEKVLNGARSWVLIGGPPCQAYSLVGRARMLRDRGEKDFFADERHTLYREYLYILARHQPDVFVMENVKGVLSSKLEDDFAFRLIRRDLAAPTKAMGMDGEQVEYELFPLSPPDAKGSDEGRSTGTDFIVKCEDHGVPQARHRVIILGVRKDRMPAEGLKNARLTRVKRRRTVEDAIGDLPKLRSGLSKEKDSPEAWISALALLGSTTWAWGLGEAGVREKLEKIGRRQSTRLGRGGEFLKHTPPQAPTRSLLGKLLDRTLGGVCNHTSRGHIREDIHRYAFASAFAAAARTSPKLADFPDDLLPNHKNVDDAVDGKIFSDRFRVQLKDKPSATITSHIAKDGHYFIHYDAWQARSFTVREAARIQTFPDNYFFEGPRTEQYRQVGNAVPPLLAKQIAAVVHRVLDQLHSARGQADSRATQLEHGPDQGARHAS